MKHTREWTLAAVLAAILTTLAWRAPDFFRLDFQRQLAVSMAPTLVAAIGMTLAIVARQVDISIGAQASIGAVVGGMAAAAGLPLPAAFATAIFAAAAFGAINGILVTRLGFPAIVATLATATVGKESLRWAREGEFVRNLPSGFQWFGFGMEAGSATILAIAGTLFIVATLAMRYLPAARAFLAVGSDEEAAHVLGLRADRVAFMAFVILGVLTGVAAVLDAVRFSHVDPNCGNGLELRTIAAVVVGGASVSGGRGSMFGSLLGVALLGVIGPALVFLHIEPQWEKAIQGLIVLVAVAADVRHRGRDE